MNTLLRQAPRLLALLTAVTAFGPVACFDPQPGSMSMASGDGKADELEPGPGSESGPSSDSGTAPMCIDAGDPCESPAECCVGGSLCAGYDGELNCTPTCESDDDCPACCGAVDGLTDHGACAECVGIPFSDVASCLDGVTQLCACVEGTEAECTDSTRAGFETLCEELGSEDAQMLICMGESSSCEAAAGCIPDEE